MDRNSMNAGPQDVFFTSCNHLFPQLKATSHLYCCKSALLEQCPLTGTANTYHGVEVYSYNGSIFLDTDQLKVYLLHVEDCSPLWLKLFCHAISRIFIVITSKLFPSLLFHIFCEMKRVYFRKMYLQERRFQAWRPWLS